MYELKKNGKVFTSEFVRTGPSSYEKRIYRAAVSQRLRNTELKSSEKNIVKLVRYKGLVLNSWWRFIGNQNMQHCTVPFIKYTFVWPTCFILLLREGTTGTNSQHPICNFLCQTHNMIQPCKAIVKYK